MYQYKQQDELPLTDIFQSYTTEVKSYPWKTGKVCDFTKARILLKDVLW